MRILIHAPQCHCLGPGQVTPTALFSKGERPRRGPARLAHALCRLHRCTKAKAYVHAPSLCPAVQVSELLAAAAVERAELRERLERLEQQQHDQDLCKVRVRRARPRGCRREEGMKEAPPGTTLVFRGRQAPGARTRLPHCQSQCDIWKAFAC